MLRGTDGDPVEPGGEQIFDEFGLGDQKFIADLKVFQISFSAPAEDGSPAVPGEFADIRHRDQILFVAEFLFQIGPVHPPFRHVQIVYGRRCGFLYFRIRIARGSDIPSRGSLVFERMEPAVDQIMDDILGFDGVAAGLLAGILTGDKTACEQIQRGAFADVRHLIELILGHGFRVFLPEFGKVFFLLFPCGFGLFRGISLLCGAVIFCFRIHEITTFCDRFRKPFRRFRAVLYSLTTGDIFRALYTVSTVRLFSPVLSFFSPFSPSSLQNAGKVLIFVLFRRFFRTHAVFR